MNIKRKDSPAIKKQGKTKMQEILAELDKLRRQCKDLFDENLFLKKKCSDYEDEINQIKGILGNNENKK